MRLVEQRRATGMAGREETLNPATALTLPLVACLTRLVDFFMLDHQPTIQGVQLGVGLSRGPSYQRLCSPVLATAMKQPVPR
jgi:hypothetical protein